METKEKHKSATLWQSNILTKARYELTKLEKNILYLVMREMKRTDPPGQLYYVSTKELSEKTGEEINYGRMRDVTTKLLSRVLEGKLPNGNLLQVHFFSSVEYLTGTGTIEVEMSPKIRPFYLDLKSEFTTYQLDLAISLNSIYAKRFYETFSMYKNMENKVFRIKVDALKHQFGLVDPKTGEGKYPLYADFKRNVLRPAEEINTKSDLAFSYREIKVGRKVDELEFTITYTPTELPIDFNAQETNVLGRLIDNFKLRKDQAVQVLRTMPLKELNQQLYQIQLRINSGGVQNIGSYTAHALGLIKTDDNAVSDNRKKGK